MAITVLQKLGHRWTKVRISCVSDGYVPGADGDGFGFLILSSRFFVIV